MNFSDFKLDPRVDAGVKACGYETPTPVQEQAIPPAMAGQDVMGLAQTGTGKTAAFALPILHRLIDGPRGVLRALIVAPTRELAEQIRGSFEELGRGARLRTVTIYGGVGMRPQTEALRRGVDIVVACPGRLLDHLRQRTADLSRLEVLVLDEADMMLDMGFLPDIRRILHHLPAKRQNLLYSATMPREIRTLADEILTNPATVQIRHSAPAETVAHALYPVAQNLKTALLVELLDRTSTDSVLIFTRTKHRAKRLGDHLVKIGHRAASLQGNLSQNARQAALSGFRTGRHNVLVATDIAARGIDVSQVSHVINFDIPDTTDAYTHRIGRTGRAERTGDAFTLVTHEDREMIRDIERVLGAPIERRTLEGFDYKQTPVKLEAPGRSDTVRRPGGRKPEGRRNGNRVPAAAREARETSLAPTGVVVREEPVRPREQAPYRKPAGDAPRKPRDPREQRTPKFRTAKPEFGQPREGARPRPEGGRGDATRTQADRKPRNGERKDWGGKPRPSARPHSDRTHKPALGARPARRDDRKYRPDSAQPAGDGGTIFRSAGSAYRSQDLSPKPRFGGGSYSGQQRSDMPKAGPRKSGSFGKRRGGKPGFGK